MKRIALPLILVLTLTIACSDDVDVTPDAGSQKTDQAAAKADQSASAKDQSPDTTWSCTPPASKGSFHALKAKMDGKERSMCRYRGKVLLVVNIAAKCGFTPQLGGLATLQSKHGAKFEVVGFYCNQFLNQGGTEKEQSSCETQYGVNFDTYDTLNVNAPAEHSVFTWLKSQANGGGKVTWNFEKWLLGKDGTVLKRWATGVKPDSAEIDAAIKAALAK